MDAWGSLAKSGLSKCFIYGREAVLSGLLTQNRLQEQFCLRQLL